MLFVDRATRCIISWALVSQRTFDTMQPLADAVWQHSAQHGAQRSAQSRVFYSDQLETYCTLLYRNGTHQPQPDKSQTYSVEGCNADLRCYVSALIRPDSAHARLCAIRGIAATPDLAVAVLLQPLCYNRRCIGCASAVHRAWARQWPPLRATCEDAEQEKKQKQRLRRRLLYRYPIISFLPALL